MVKSRKSQTERMRIRVFDGTRNPINTFPVMYRVADGEHKQVFQKNLRSCELSVTDLEVHDNYLDDHTVEVSAPGYKLHGIFPVKITNSHVAVVNLMLLPDKSEFHFFNWEAIQSISPKLAKLLSAGETAADAKNRYEELIASNQQVAACLMNIVAAMDQILLTSGSALDLLVQIDWSARNARDRFFIWCQPGLLNEIRVATQQCLFAEEKGCAVFHPGSTCSYKQLDFGEANVQITFHEKETKSLAGQSVMKIEVDIDYFKDLLAHSLMEVAANQLTGQISDPKQVYALRWMAGKQAGRPEFTPSYSIV